jgi:hypothetical protein
MIFYLGHPGSQLHAHLLADMPVCITYAKWRPWNMEYAPTWSRLLVDSGAYSALNSGQEIDVNEYIEWSQQWIGKADAIASLDDISGDYKTTIKNCELMPKGAGFPTIHEADPIEILPDLIELAKDHGNWLGIGLTPLRYHKENIVRNICEQIPDGIHVHGWALGEYGYLKRLDSVDSIGWLLITNRVQQYFPWLTHAERVEILIKKYARWIPPTDTNQQDLFSIFKEE